ncbi:MAG: archaeosine biosynthesis radical SAM protein RaSEA [Candidatus Thorarchaeota archaeon]
MVNEFIPSLHESILRETNRARRDSIKRRKSKDLSRPAAAWVTTSIIGSSQGAALSIVLTTVGCGHARGDSGGCTMCSYLLDGTEKAPSSDQLLKQFQYAMTKIDDKESPLSVKLYTSGSFLDKEEVPVEVRNRILDILSKDDRIAEVVIESRPEYVTPENMGNLRESLGNRRIEIGIGLESSNDSIRDLCINKGFTLQEFQNAVSIAKEYAIGIRAYILLKPPFLSEKNAIEDATRTIQECEFLGVSTVSVNPVNVQKFTLVERLWERGDYRPPWLWSLVEVLKQSRNSLSSAINIVCDPVASGKQRGVHNCGKCDPDITNAIRRFSLSQKLDEFNNLSCGCRHRWEHILQHEEISSLIHADR